MNKLNGIINNGNTSGSIDKPCRTVQSDCYTFGYDEKAETKTRLIVKEQNLKHVRVYELEDGTNYYCYGCFAKNKSKNYAHFDDCGFLMVPERHDCELIPVEVSNQDQKTKRTAFMEANKLSKAAKLARSQASPALLGSKLVTPQASPALPVSSSGDSSKDIPFVDLTEFSENPVTDAFENFRDGDGGNEEMVLSSSMGRSNASSPEYIPESSPSNSFPSSPSVAVTNSIQTSMVPSSLTKTSVLDMQTSDKNTSENDADRVSSQSFNVTETSSEHTQSITSPSGSNGKENKVKDEIRNVASGDKVKVHRKMIKTERTEYNPTVITLDDTLDDDDNNISHAAEAEENEDYFPIESEDYQYGYSQNGIPNCRLIAFDTKDCRELVRQYSKISNRKQWFCLGCYRARRKHNKAYFVGETFMVPKKHFCQKFKYTEAKEMQREYIQKMNLPGATSSNKTVEKAHTRSRTVAPADGVSSFSRSRTVAPAVGDSSVSMVILSPRGEKRVGQKVIKTDTSEFDDGYHDYSTTSSSPLDDVVDPGDDEDYHPSHETERTPTRDFKFGFSAKKGNRNGRLIVFEPNDKTKVRQYAWNNCNFYFCIECYRLKKKKFGGKIDGAIFMAPKNHFCKPVSVEEAMQQQKEIVEKFGLGRPANNGGSSNEVSVRISQRLQNKRDNGGDESDGYEETDESANPIPYHSTPTDNRRRLVQAGDFKYGVGNANQENFKIIVFEENNRDFVRVYGRKTQRQWYCCGCLRLKHSNYGTVNQQTFNAPIEHTCKPLTHESVLQIQQRIKDRYRKISSTNTFSSKTSPNSGLSLSNVAPVKPGSSVSPPQEKSRAEFEFRNNEKLKNLVIKNPPSRNMVSAHASENSSKHSFNSSGEYREIDSLHYEYGYNKHGEKQKLLIVYERNRAFVREYSIDGSNKWNCEGCSNGFARKEADKFFVTIRHNCIPIHATASRENQSRYKALVPASTPASRLSISSVNDNMPVNFNQSLSTPDQNKSLLSLPSNYGEVHPNNWQYGYDSYGNPNKRIIVRDAENPDDGHEYRNDKNDTRCLGCAKNGKVAAKIIDGTLYVPPSKDHTCEPRNYSEIQRLQKEYRKNMGRKRGRTVFSMEATSSKRPKIVAEKDNESNPEEYGLEDSYMDNSSIVVPQTVVDKSIVNKVGNLSKLSSSNSSTAVSFYSPSAFFLSKCCKELNIKYSNDAYKFWSQILVEKINVSSRPVTTYKTKEAMYHGFSCFSLFFTGNESNTPIIREMFNRYVYNNFKSLGICMGHDFSEYNHETPIIRDTLWSFALTEIHLECLSRWFECRIAIYEGKKWKRYGNWDDVDSPAPTFLIEIKDGKCNPIFTLA